MYPTISEYLEAIKAAEDNFDQLKHLRPVLDDDGMPVMSGGNFAVVFKMKDEQTGKLHAVKCFLREQEGRAEAYRQIAEELEYVSSTFLTSIKYLDKELFVDTDAGEENEFPVLLMDWVEGQTLDKYIREHIDDQYELSLLAYQFSRLAMWLLPQPFAHGDLKPDNILVKEDGTLVLVDYDGMYVPAMKGQKARELGSPDFRHPGRTEDVFDEHIDDFSLVSILLSLKAIALQPELLEQYGASDRLLFSEKDYRNLSESRTMDAIKHLISCSEFAQLLSLFFLSAFRKNIYQMSFCLEQPSQSPSNNATDVCGVIVDDIGGKKYLYIYENNNICELTNIEEKAVDGLRIVEFVYGKILNHFLVSSPGCTNTSYVDTDIRYGLINEKNQLVSKCDYFGLSRLSNGNISALYPDPKENGIKSWGKERFQFTLNAKGQPLFEYTTKGKDGTKTPSYCALNDIDAVSSCYYGIALFVRNHKIGIVDYKGNILIKSVSDDIIIDDNNSCITTVMFDKKHHEGFDTRKQESLVSSTTYLFKRGGALAIILVQA